VDKRTLLALGAGADLVELALDDWFMSVRSLCDSFGLTEAVKRAYLLSSSSFVDPFDRRQLLQFLES
jgi:hypothetical protein